MDLTALKTKVRELEKMLAEFSSLYWKGEKFEGSNLGYYRSKTVMAFAKFQLMRMFFSSYAGWIRGCYEKVSGQRRSFEESVKRASKEAEENSLLTLTSCLGDFYLPTIEGLKTLESEIGSINIYFNPKSNEFFDLDPPSKIGDERIIWPILKDHKTSGEDKYRVIEVALNALLHSQVRVDDRMGHALALAGQNGLAERISQQISDIFEELVKFPI